MSSIRVIAILPGLEPLRGRCPSCLSFMDDTHCRIGAHQAFRVSAGFKYRDAPGWRGVRVGQIVEVFCTAHPVDRLEPCPCCETHPGVAPCPSAPLPDVVTQLIGPLARPEGWR